MLIPTAALTDLEDDSNMWSMYLDEVQEEDNRITFAWKDDANSFITFVSHNLLVPVFISVTSSKTGLLSATVGAFIIEFYKKLSPDSGDQTVALLQQISHQLPNSPNSAYSNTANQPSPPRTTMVWVNALWLISLVLSLTCASIAMLLQQWVRKYTETPRSANVLRHRVRIRSLLLVGFKMYNVALIIEMLPALLHLSVYLFLGGLVIALHTIDKTVAIAVDVAVGVSGLAYITFSILPCLDMKCPYRTLTSRILWYPCHALLSLAALCLRSCGFSVSNHWRFLMDGLEKNIVFRAVKKLRDGDRGRVTWLFNRLALGDKDKFLMFAASIPRYKIPNLIPTIESGSFRESLLVLLRSCIASRYTAGPDEDVHERSLLVCLHAICHIVKANAPTILDLNSMQAHFANTCLMRSLWGDMDDSIRITSRSICALVARQVVRKRRLEVAGRSWLQEVTGESSNSILEADVTMLDQMNFKSFVIGALPNFVPHLDLSTEDATTLNETLAILLGVGTDDHNYFTTPYWQIRLSEEVGQIQRYDPQGGFEVFDRLRSVFPSLPAHAVVLPSHSIPPPSPVLPPPHEVPRAPPSPRPAPSLVHLLPLVQFSLVQFALPIELTVTMHQSRFHYHVPHIDLLYHVVYDFHTLPRYLAFFFSLIWVYFFGIPLPD